MHSPVGKKAVRPRCCLRTEVSECRGGSRGDAGSVLAAGVPKQVLGSARLPIQGAHASP